MRLLRFPFKRVFQGVAAFCIGVMIALYLNSGMLVSYKFAQAYNDVGKLNREIEVLSQYAPEDGIPIDRTVLNDWLSGNLPDAQPFVQELLAPPECDPWGKPYRYSLSNNGFYSTGRDGTTETTSARIGISTRSTGGT
ncbi:MAG: hypothetical protein CMJ78_09035 [Planctomycetaceae bacterium]|nr:hypothetical protein [Planctomycetaceae bacterium]